MAQVLPARANAVNAASAVAVIVESVAIVNAARANQGQLPMARLKPVPNCIRLPMPHQPAMAVSATQAIPSTANATRVRVNVGVVVVVAAVAAVVVGIARA